jgi:hypothetical protein
MVGGLLALCLFGGIVWHLVNDVMTDIVAFIPPDRPAGRLWVEHLRSAGLWVRVVEDTNPDSTRRHLHVPDRLAANHTALTMYPAHYVISGHVPADVIARMREERPRITGLAVPGSPAGAPGVSTKPAVPCDICAFWVDGRAVVYAHREPAAR